MSSIPAVIEVTNSSASFEDFQKLNLMIRKFNVGIVLKNLPKYYALVLFGNERGYEGGRIAHIPTPNRSNE